MNRVIAAYDLDEDHGRLWVNADLKRMPEVVVVANQPMDRAQTVTYVPEARMLEAMDAAREAGRRADMADRVAADRKGLCDSLKETNADLRRIIDEMRETGSPAAENAKLRELCKELYPFVGNACPDDCKHREECEGEGNRGAHGFPLVCVAYNRYFEDLRECGIEVQS